MLKIYNTISRKKEIFLPISIPEKYLQIGELPAGKRVNLFVCGPTVYDFPHIGHARTYVFFDAFVKYLREQNFDVFYLQNITDIDDKIISRAQQDNVSAKKLALRFEKEYIKDIRELKVNSVTKYARATEYIKEIQRQIKKLIEKKYAYETKDGVYYNVSKFKDYGKLSGRTLLRTEDAVSRIDESGFKKNKRDFCLWKIVPMPQKASQANPYWKSPWGKGRPGWHIEDTAICEKYFGAQYDIHGGARDLIFPHHEAEIAQMEAVSGKRPMVKYWVHSGFLTIKNRKMAKSTGNFITIKDFLKKESPRLLRFLFIKTHYRSPINYNKNILLQAKQELKRIDEFVEKVRLLKSEGVGLKNEFGAKILKKTEEEFAQAIEDDFNTPKAIAALFELINKENGLLAQNEFNSNDARDALAFLKKIDRFLNFIFWQKSEKKIPKEITELLLEREKYRKAAKWREADEIRKKIQKMGYQIEDTKKGPKLKI